MSRVVTATHARTHLGELMREVVDHQEAIVVERSGRPQIVLLSLDEYQRLCGGKSELSAWLERTEPTRQRIQDAMGDHPLPDIDDLIDGGRQERDDAIIASLC